MPLIDGHKVQGYQVHEAETYFTDKDGDSLSHIAHVVAEKAHMHDSDALILAIESSAKLWMQPEKMLVDTLLWQG